MKTITKILIGLVIVFVVVPTMIVAIFSSDTNTNLESTPEEPKVVISNAQIVSMLEAKYDKYDIPYNRLEYNSIGIMKVYKDNSIYLSKADQRTFVDASCLFVHDFRGNPDSSTIVILYDGSLKVAEGKYYPPYIIDVEMKYY